MLETMEKPKSLIFIERLKSGEEIKCPLCKEGTWRMVRSNSGKACMFKCDKCGKAIVPKISTI